MGQYVCVISDYFQTQKSRPEGRLFHPMSRIILLELQQVLLVLRLLEQLELQQQVLLQELQQVLLEQLLELQLLVGLLLQRLALHLFCCKRSKQ